MPDFALFLQTCHFPPALFDFLFRVGPVHLIQVDCFNTEAFQAVFALFADAIGF